MEGSDLTTSHNTFVEMFNLELNKKTIADVEVTKDNFKHILTTENNKTKALEDEWKKIERENNELKKNIQSYKNQIDTNKTEYTNLIFSLRNELKTETNNLASLNERNAELDNINKAHKEQLEKIQANIDSEVRKRKNTERRAEAKNLEQMNKEKQLEVLKAKQKVLQAEIKDINEQIEQCIHITNMLEDKYQSSVSFGRNLSEDYKELECQSEMINKEKQCLMELLKCHESTNSKLAQLIIENINPCEERNLLNELSEMMSDIDKENNRHQHTMEQIRYERDMHYKMLKELGKKYTPMSPAQEKVGDA